MNELIRQAIYNPFVYPLVVGAIALATMYSTLPNQEIGSKSSKIETLVDDSTGSHKHH